MLAKTLVLQDENGLLFIKRLYMMNNIVGYSYTRTSMISI